MRCKIIVSVLVFFIMVAGSENVFAYGMSSKMGENAVNYPDDKFESYSASELQFEDEGETYYIVREQNNLYLVNDNQKKLIATFEVINDYQTEFLSLQSSD